jgi:hypothetical protein
VLGPLTDLAVVLSGAVVPASVTGGGIIGTTGVASPITGWAWVGASERDSKELSNDGAGVSEPGLRVGRDSVGSWDDEGVPEGAVSQEGSLPYVDHSDARGAGVASDDEAPEPVPK